MDQEELIGNIGKLLKRFDPDAKDSEYHCPTAFAILQARVAGDAITKDNFPQLFMKEA